MKNVLCIHRFDGIIFSWRYSVVFLAFYLLWVKVVCNKTCIRQDWVQVLTMAWWSKKHFLRNSRLPVKVKNQYFSLIFVKLNFNFFDFFLSDCNPRSGCRNGGTSCEATPGLRRENELSVWHPSSFLYRSILLRVREVFLF